MYETIMKKFQNAKSYLDKRENDFAAAYTNPEFIITNLFNGDHKSHYELGIKVLENQGIRYHKIQKEIGKILIEFLQSLDNEVEVKLRNENTYPSSFSIRFMNTEIIAFNIYKHIFGDFRYKQTITNFDDSLKFKKEEIEINKNKQWRDNPYKLLKGNFKFKKKPYIFMRNMILDIWYLISKKKEILSHLDKTIVRFEKQVQNHNLSTKEIEINKSKFIQEEPLIQIKFEEWRQRFLNWGYEERERRSYEFY